MEIGFAVPVAGSWATPDNQVRIASRAEEYGYHSLWTLQRLAYPADAVESFYRNVPDPLVTLAYLAGFTTRVRLGVAVMNMPFISPILLAKQATTLDQVSHGRLDLGLGLGWMPEEFIASGVSPARRGARAEEFLAVLRGLWTHEVCEFHGEFYQLPPVRMDPKPVQRPHPPILIGGGSERALRRAGRVADGWVSSSRMDLTRIGELITVVKNAARDAGRDPDSLRMVCRGLVAVRPAGRPNRRPLTGSYDEIRADLGILTDQGVTEVFYDLNFDAETVGPGTDPLVAIRHAEHMLAALAP